MTRTMSRASPATRHGACSTCPIRRLSAFRSFQPAEIDFIEKLKGGEVVIPAGSLVYGEGESSDSFYTVLDGWAMRYRQLENGRRQVLNFSLRGDLLGLQSVLFGKLLHSVEALTDLRLCVFPRARIWEMFEQHAGLAFDMTWLAAREESILADHLVNVGQSPARQRLAYIIMHLLDRARRADLTKDNRLSTPVTQEHLGDVMGLSIVHTNKTIRKLKAGGLIDWRRNEIVVRDEAALAALGAYERREGQPRPFI